MSSRIINCPLYGFINITPRMGFIIDTPEFKRLHNLRQLGATYLVYPSANHTRFEHSLGVSHLAKKLLLSLKEKNPMTTITDELIELVQIAGLIHDIGHGPFSHLYDDYIIGENDMEHEERGIEIFKKMVKENTMPFTEHEVKFITSLINPNENAKNNWLFQIVANKYCSIDVDKIDYIQRDSYHLGFGLSEKYERLITMCDIKEFEGNMVLAWPDKLQDEIISLFETRYRLHKKVYCHHTVKSCEFIITDLLNNIIYNNNLEFKYLYDDIISFPFTQTTRELKDKSHIPDFNMTLMVWIPSLIIGNSSEIPDEWHMNDGIVSTASMNYPINSNGDSEPHQSYNPNNIIKGTWQVMEPIHQDHHIIIGHRMINLDEEDMKLFYKDICSRLYGLD